MKKLLVWGTGSVAKKMIQQGLNGRIVGFIESKKRRNEFEKLPVFEPGEVVTCDYDYIIVASTYAEEISDSCEKNGIPHEQVIFLNPCVEWRGIQDVNLVCDILGERNYSLYCAKRKIYQGTFWEKDLITYNSLNKRESFEAREEFYYPCLDDKYADAGSLDNYFIQDLWAAKKIIKSGVTEHWDIGSRVDGFITHLLAAGIHTKMIDVREFPYKIENLETILADATSLCEIEDDSVESLSALCSLEHFGLGRYGDPVDPEACFKCFTNIQAKIKKGGSIYIAVPIGKEHVEFNAHRIFYASTIIDCFDKMKCVEISCSNNGEFEGNIDIHKYDEEWGYGASVFGLFHFVK